MSNRVAIARREQWTARIGAKSINWRELRASAGSAAPAAIAAMAA
jgi:hypothetical protein